MASEAFESSSAVEGSLWNDLGCPPKNPTDEELELEAPPSKLKDFLMRRTAASAEAATDRGKFFSLSSSISFGMSAINQNNNVKLASKDGATVKPTGVIGGGVLVDDLELGVLVVGVGHRAGGAQVNAAVVAPLDLSLLDLSMAHGRVGRSAGPSSVCKKGTC